MHRIIEEILRDEILSTAGREKLERLLDEITPMEVRIERMMDSYVGEVAVVGDVIETLNIDPKHGWLIGQILSKRGYEQRTVTGVRCWVLPSCRYPKVYLSALTQRRKAHARVPLDASVQPPRVS